MTFDVPLAGTREPLRQAGAQLEIERRERGTTVRAIAPLPSRRVVRQLAIDGDCGPFLFGGLQASLKLHRNVVGDCPTIRRKSRLNWVSD
jgi:hypothetical protein